MNEKVVVITGANSGIGKETTVALAAMGSTTVLGSRLAPARGTRITTSPWPYTESKLGMTRRPSGCVRERASVGTAGVSAIR